MKKYLFCFLVLLLSAVTVFAAGGQDMEKSGAKVEAKRPSSTFAQPRTPPPPLEEAWPLPPPYEEPLISDVPFDRAAAGQAQTGQARQAQTGQARQAQAGQTQAEQARQARAEQARQAQTEQARQTQAKQTRVKETVPVEVKVTQLKSMGVSVGTSFAAPMLILTPRVTLSSSRNLFFELGCDIGAFSALREDYNTGYSSGSQDVPYDSVFPYINIDYFKPFTSKSGWYLGGGMGLMFQTYYFKDGEEPMNTFALNIGTGFVIGNVIDLSYTIRTNFTSANHKFSAGLIYRFK